MYYRPMNIPYGEVSTPCSTMSYAYTDIVELDLLDEAAEEEDRW